MKLTPRVERAMDDRVDRRLVEAADRLPHLPATAERHRPQAQFRHEHSGVGELTVFHLLTSSTRGYADTAVADRTLWNPFLTQGRLRHSRP